MILKKLKIKGFKSFPDPVVIEFQPQITAIVGPNGSGKSNIVDAIRWALGEQSAKLLRGSKMEDLIFSGSSTRREMESAEVYLTLDNSDNTLPIDQKEVTIGRRVDRSGESDYLINNQVCRLKDIQDLIMDTGIGKEAYSVIGQGKIDDLLSSRPQDRREIFEEAAGVMKYKHRKKEAMRKLEKTQQDLLRIEDIINELENRLKPVAREAKKARKYRELYTRLRELEIARAGARWEQIEVELSGCQEELSSLRDMLSVDERRMAEYEDNVQVLEREKEELLERLEIQKDKVFNTKTRIEQLKNKINVYRERENNARDNLDRLEDELGREEKILAECHQEIEETQKQVSACEQRMELLNGQIKNIEQELEANQAEIQKKVNQKEAINSSLVDFLNDRAEVKNRLAVYREKSREISLEIEEVETERNELAARLDRVMNEEDQVREKLIALRDEELELSRDREQQLTSINQLEVKMKDFEQRCQKKRELLQHLNSNLDLLQRMEDQREGYYRGVKKILYARDRGEIDGIYGVVAELIEVDPSCEQAVAAVLGGKLQNVVVRDTRVAKEAIDYLRKHKSGRATFMPLDLIRQRTLRKREKKVLDMEGVLGIAADFVEFEPHLAPAVNNLLGRVIITRDKDTAVRAFEAVQGSLLFATLEGETVNPGGTITGGSINEKQLDLLTRSRQIDEIKEKIEAEKRQLTSLSQDREKVAVRLVGEKRRLEELEKQLRQNEMAVLSCQKDLEGLKSNSARMREEIAGLDNKFVQLYEKLGGLDVKIRDMEEELNLIGSDNEQQEELLSGLERQLKELKEAREELNEKLVEKRVELVSLEKKLEHLKAETKRLVAARNRSGDRIAELKEERQVQLETLEMITGKIAEFQDDLKKTEEELAGEEAALERLKEKEDRVHKRLKVDGEELNNLRKTVQQLEKKVNSLELKTAKISMEKEQLKETMWEEYEIDITDIESNPDFDLREVAREIKMVKEEIRQLGSINPGSIQEYEELKERLDYLHHQHDDLNSAREYLFQIIAQMDEIVQVKFLETFKQVKVHFEEIFRKIFGGGKAELFLTDPDDLLETGIEINAQPPGKKLQKMSLMSGGEKALTATALVFSLLRVKPSPFYILDEIDAPLDEANVDRFAQFLREFASVAQFILITHRKRSMAEADALYGVTMEDSGVSKIVSMKLAEQAVS